jgi:hypothetical protein
MQSVRVRRTGISADRAAEVIGLGMGGEYQVRAEGEATLVVSKGLERARVVLREEPGGTVFEVSGDGVSVLPLFSVTTKMLNERGIARRTAAAIGKAEAFRDGG